MKKNIFFFLAAILLLAASCTDNKSYNISGTFANKDLDGKNIYMGKLNDLQDNIIPIDTAVIKDGKFSFKGDANDTAVVRFIMLDGQDLQQDMQIQSPVLFILEGGDIKISWDTLATVKGTKLNDQYQEYVEKRRGIEKSMKQLIDEYELTLIKQRGQITPEQIASLEAKREPINKQMGDITFEYIKSTINTPIGEFMFLALAESLGKEQIEETLTMLSPEMEKNENIQNLKRYIDLSKATNEGSNYTDVKGLDPKGQEVYLKNYVSNDKYVLIDFWASWCKPCMQEMPNLAKLYNEYNKKGFEIVGISLDDDKNAWLKAIKDNNMSWPQMIDSDDSASTSYVVQSIPYTVLIDKEGKIIAKGLTGANLEKKLQELFQ